jgi:hypothetical protein
MSRKTMGSIHFIQALDEIIPIIKVTNTAFLHDIIKPAAHESNLLSYNRLALQLAQQVSCADSSRVRIVLVCG